MKTLPASPLPSTPLAPARGLAAIVERKSQARGRQGHEGDAPARLRCLVYCRKSTEDEDRQVMSIPSQQSELAERFPESNQIEIIDRVEESMSAKRPGRVVFNRLLDRIEAGEADCLVAWAPDRLARNSIDGGRIIYLLDRGLIRDLKFATWNFENNAQGKFMLQIAFAQSKHYSDNLSDVIKRGNRAKLERGWVPSGYRIGYVRCAETNTTIPDPTLFPLVRRMFDLFLSGSHRPAEIVRIAGEDWGMRTPQRKKFGGKPIALSSFYKMLCNPFYAGVILWNGAVYQGRHQPLVTLAEFDQIQRLLGRAHQERPQKHSFPFTGTMRCGACGLMITAEHKRNRYGSFYTYYHCTKRMMGPRCQEPSIRAADLDTQIAGFLGTLAVPDVVERAVLDVARASEGEIAKEQAARRTSLEGALQSAERQLKELTGLRLRQLLTDAEFVVERARLESEQLRLRDQMAQAQNATPRFEPLEELFLFRKYAVEWFRVANDADKRLIFKIAGSNPVLTGKKLSVEAAKPFVALPDFPEFLCVRRGLEDVRYTKHTKAKITRAVDQLLAGEDIPGFVSDIKELRERMEHPETMVSATCGCRAQQDLPAWRGLPRREVARRKPPRRRG
jgi:DNA invertase Pin-like site-specific DNA recombinase